MRCCFWINRKMQLRELKKQEALLDHFLEKDTDFQRQHPKPQQQSDAQSEANLSMTTFPNKTAPPSRIHSRQPSENPADVSLLKSPVNS